MKKLINRPEAVVRESLIGMGASYLGERSIGHQDPGATSAYLMLKALYAAVS